MHVLKFGGTSVGNADRIKQVGQIVNDGQKKIVVLSAMSGTTNALIEISNDLRKGHITNAKTSLKNLNNWYAEVVQNLLTTKRYQKKATDYILSIFSNIDSQLEEEYLNVDYNELVSYGELLSTFLFDLHLKELKIDSVLIPALNFMQVDENNEPILKSIQEKLQAELNEVDAEIYITQGFITLNTQGKISNLARGGSDYTATLIGAALNVDEVQIWTDIDGFHNNDPRIIEGTNRIPQLSYEEAAELAYFGAKILHPQTVTPVRNRNIPIRLKNTMMPLAKGTLITKKPVGVGVKAIAAKDGITAIKIKSERMLLAYGFLKRVFEVFELFKTPIDMITTSEVAVSLTIDDTKHLDEITDILKQFAKVEVDTHQTIICIAGNNIVNDSNTHKIFNVLQNVAVRMISYGGSDSNISILIDHAAKEKTLKLLHNYAFNASIPI